MSENKTEWDETFELLEGGNETVISMLTFGNFVTLPTELFDNMINEINNSRVKNRVEGEDLELIVIGEVSEESNESGD
jgi:hypothetical protein